MQANSAANRAPAARPPGDACRRARPSGMPRATAAHSQHQESRRRCERSAACESGGNLRQRQLRRAPGSGPRARSRRGRASRPPSASRCRLALGHRDHRYGASPAVPRGASALRAAGGAHRRVVHQRRSEPVPATAPLAWANGADRDVPAPAGWRSVAPHGASVDHLDRGQRRASARRSRAGVRACHTNQPPGDAATPACSTPDRPP